VEKYLKIYEKLKPAAPGGFTLIPITNILAVRVVPGTGEITIIYNDRTKSGKRPTIITTLWASTYFEDTQIIFKREILDALASDQQFTLSTLTTRDVTTNVSL